MGFFNVSCKKCGKEFEVEEPNHKFPKKSKYFCSRSCANSRGPRSNETKEKISKSVTNHFKKNGSHLKGKTKSKVLCIKKCPQCNKTFEVSYIKRNITFCSPNCAKYTSRHSNIDWSKVNKKSYNTGNNYIAGGTTKWYQYKNINVQGTYELRTCKILDRWLEEGKIYNWEYTNDRFTYIGIDEKEHTYLVDFKIYDNQNEFYYLETKGWIHQNDELKWQAVRDKGYKLIVWRENDIQNNEII
jgi:hypothetical protein